MKIKNYKGKILFLLFLILLMSLLLLKMCKTSLPTNENFNDSNKIGVIIPCTKNHVKYLFNLIKNINNQSLKPHEISISISEIEEYECNNIKKNVNHNFKI